MQAPRRKGVAAYNDEISKNQLDFAIKCRWVAFLTWYVGKGILSIMNIEEKGKFVA